MYIWINVSLVILYKEDVVILMSIVHNNPQ